MVSLYAHTSFMFDCNIHSVKYWNVPVTCFVTVISNIHLSTSKEVTPVFNIFNSSLLFQMYLYDNSCGFSSSKLLILLKFWLTNVLMKFDFLGGNGRFEPNKSYCKLFNLDLNPFGQTNSGPLYLRVHLNIKSSSDAWLIIIPDTNCQYYPKRYEVSVMACVTNLIDWHWDATDSIIRDCL